MSGIGGVFNFYGVPIGDAVLPVLGDALDNRGADGGSEIEDGPVGMVYRGFHTNAESRLEEQPLQTSSGHLLAWDGRLDNRDDLLGYFPHGLGGDTSDVALVLAAHLKWGSEFLSRIVGDFVLSLYDRRSSSLFLARDPFGTRTLYYSVNESRVAWSSTLEAILAVTGLEPDVR